MDCPPCTGETEQVGVFFDSIAARFEFPASISLGNTSKCGCPEPSRQRVLFLQGISKYLLANHPIYLYLFFILILQQYHFQLPPAPTSSTIGVHQIIHLRCIFCPWMLLHYSHVAAQQRRQLADCQKKSFRHSSDLLGKKSLALLLPIARLAPQLHV